MASQELAEHLSQYGDDDILQALTLLVTTRPELRTAVSEVMQMSKRYIGTITAYSEKNCYGFIHAEEVTAEYGQDAFLSSHEIGQFGKGSTVAFSVGLNKGGQPQARALEDPNAEGAFVPQKRGWEGGSAGAPPAKKGKGGATGFVTPGFVGKAPVAAAAPLESSWSEWGDDSWKGKGKGKDWDWSKGKGKDWGKDSWGKDSWGKDSWGGKDWGKDWGKGKGGGKGSWKGDGTRYVGVIQTFKPENMYGFVKCDQLFMQYGQDVFISSHEMGSFTVGSKVSFTCGVNARGQPQAHDVTDGEGMESHDPLSARYTGTIHHFQAERKYGFITSPDLAATFGGDCFLSVNEIKEFKNEDTVSFGITLNKMGKPQAKDLTAPGASP